MILGIDHVVILVNDLAVACDDYTALGFTVVPGGEHTDGATHNALIAFEDGSYLELLAFKQAVPDHRWWRHVAIGEGLIDWAMIPDAITTDITAANRYEAVMDGPIAGGRQRPDGQQIAWEMGIQRTPDLPFLCGDVTPRSLRVPTGEARTHRNGVTGIAGLTVAVYDIEVSLARYRSLINVSMHGHGGQIRAAAPSGFVVPEAGAQVAMLPVGHATLTLAQPARQLELRLEAGSTGDVDELIDTQKGTAYTPLQAHMRKRGEGPYELALRVGFGGKTGTLESERTHGVRLELVSW